ncbi:MAG: pseudouridine synthase [Polyangiales bacterium]
MSSRPLVTAAPGPLAVLYQDDALVIVNKPSGLAAHRGLSSEHGDYVLTRVRDALARQVYLVHRLDRATSGAIALVLDPRLVFPLQRAFQEEQVEKRYLLLARGPLPTPTLTVDYPVPRSLETPNERVPAQTDLTQLGLHADRYALVEARPRTGRYHQIRRHMKHLQRPIIGDTTYGDNKENRLFRERHGLLRLALHARALTLPHPVTGAVLTVTAPLPPDLAHPLAAMGFAIDEKSAQLED